MTLLKFLAAGLISTFALTACSKEAKPAAAPPAPEKPIVEAPAPAAGKPALWRMGDEDTTIYLFGTVHVLPPELKWKTAPIDEALKASKAIYFETDVNPNQLQLLDVVKRLGIYTPPETLSDHLKPEERAAVAAASAKLSLPMIALDTMKPWLAAMTLSEETITKAGYDPTSGAERTLLPLATDQGKEIRKLETVEEQLLVFADLPEKVQIAYLLAGVKEIDKENELLGELVAAWTKGDVDTLDRIMIEDDLEETPEVYQALLVKRNQNWTRKLDALVKEEAGTFMVAVGAGHLAGKDSVIKMLTDKGYKIERVE